MMRRMVSRGQAMPAPGPGRPGRFPIRNPTDQENAIRAVGRAGSGEADRRAVRRFIIKRARALGLSNLVPDSWTADGSLKTSD
jgi:hypothetical protein